MMLEHLGESEAAAAIVSAIEKVLAEPKLRTRDLGAGRHPDVRKSGGRSARLSVTLLWPAPAPAGRPRPSERSRWKTSRRNSSRSCRSSGSTSSCRATTPSSSRSLAAACRQTASAWAWCSAPALRSVLRIIFTVGVVYLLATPFLKIAGGAAAVLDRREARRRGRGGAGRQDRRDRPALARGAHHRDRRRGDEPRQRARHRGGGKGLALPPDPRPRHLDPAHRRRRGADHGAAGAVSDLRLGSAPGSSAGSPARC